MTDHVRPPFVLVFAGDSAGCGYHRCAIPLMSMMLPGYAEGRLDLQLWPLEAIKLARPSTIVFQRYLEDAQVEVMKAIKEALPDVLLVYELDDYLGEVPKASFHAGFMPPDLPIKISRAAAVCHRVTTTTEPMARWFRDELGHPDVRVIPNAVPAAAVRPRLPRPDGERLRVGFCGGISHDGDLDILTHAMDTIGDGVEWVFFGGKPKKTKTRIEHHHGVPAQEYQNRMLELDLDLILAPLEENRFNECKSNLRVVEAGMIGANVIAQRWAPYIDGDPPVFSYADTPESWTQAIRDFMAASAETREIAANKLQQWVLGTHTLESRLPQRVDAWLVKDRAKKPFEPRQKITRHEKTIVCVGEGAPFPPYFRTAVRETDLVKACVRAAKVGADVLWMRPGTTLDEYGWTAMEQALVQGEAIAATVPLSPDGPNPYPRAGQWTQLPPRTSETLAAVVKENLPGRRLVSMAPSGPCALLSARALAILGAPDVEACEGSDEQAIFEWGLKAALRGWKTLQAVDAFAVAVVPPGPPIPQVAQRIQLRGYDQVLRQVPFEALSNDDRVTIELDLLKRLWGGPTPGTAGFGMDYKSWSLLKGDLPAPDSTAAAGASLAVLAFGVANVTADWVVYIDDSVHWRPNGLATLRAALMDVPDNVDFVYADHEVQNAQGDVYPDFKPDFDLELFLGRDYVTPICAIRQDALIREKQATNRAELYGLLLKYAREVESTVFHHIPKIVATLDEMPPEEQAIYTLSRQMEIEKVFENTVTVTALQMLPGALRVTHNWRAYEIETPLVSIIVPTLGAGRLIQPCIATLLQHTDYPNYEIIVMQNGPREQPELNESILADPRVRVVRWETPESGFNWAKISNDAARIHAKGEYFCFVNDDVTTGAPNWLDDMMGLAVQNDIGAVGVKLVHPAGVIQHAGVIVHKGVAGHEFKGVPNGNPCNGWLGVLTHEAQAVTGACMLTSRSHFTVADGFDEKDFPMNYNDVDYCLKLRDMGNRNVVEMSVELLHPEGATRSDGIEYAALIAQVAKDNEKLKKRWPEPDPYWHPVFATGLTSNGAEITGLNRDILLWEERVWPKTAQRVLLINDMPGPDGQAIARTKAGEIVFLAAIEQFQLRLIAPIPANIVGWDIRNSSGFSGHMKILGIDRIVLRSLLGPNGPAAPVEALKFLKASGLPVDVDPINFAVIAPWLSTDESDGSAPMTPFGTTTDMDAWRKAFGELAPELADSDEEREVA
jgi:O-antigen biosynthesis protein